MSPRGLGLILLALACPALASAAAPPRYDSARYCLRLAGTESDTLYNDCLDTEQAARNGLGRLWDALSPEAQARCARRRRARGGSYAMLRDCASMPGGASK